MADKENSSGDRIKDKIAGSSKKKKKLVIKKKTGSPSGSNIAAVYQQKKAATRSESPASPQRGSQQSGPPARSGPPPQRGPEGGRPGRPEDGQSRGQDQGRYQGQGQGSSQGRYQGQGQGSSQGRYQGQGPGQGQGRYQGQGPGQGQGRNQGQGPGQGQGRYQGQGGQAQERRGPRPQGQGSQQGRGGPAQGGRQRGGMRNAGSVYINRDVQSGEGSSGRFTGTPFDAVVESSRKAPARGKTTPGTQRKPDPRDKSQSKENLHKFYTEVERKKQVRLSGTTVPSSIEIMENIQVGELAKKLNLKPSDIISRLMKMGEMVTINHIIDAELAVRLAADFKCEVKVVSLYDETLIEAQDDQEAERQIRPPVVTVMGHVDHGKTRLLDAIRNTNIVASEAGAITQHIGAYQATIPRGTITFLDTPGHEAFTAMRARGAAVTDIVVLVVAADDGVKQQTLEAISHAREAGVPIIVAVNKIDLPAANPDKVMQQLAEQGLQPEEWGGSTIYCKVSALKGEGIEHLLEMILLQAEVLELRANPQLRGTGIIIEARIDPGKGPVATILVQKGTVEEGMPYVAGIYSGRIRAMFNDRQVRIKSAGPATPVEIIGIEGVPEAGDPFQVVESDKFARDIASKRHHYRQITEAAERAQPSLAEMSNWMQDHKELKLIIKADVKGSVEAIREGLVKLSTEDVKVKVILGSTGAISETDISLAAASNAIIIAFNVKPSARAQELASRDRVEIRTYSIIYNVLEDVKKAMEGLLEPDKIENILGRAEVREIFKISRLGNIAGCMVISGKVRKNNKVRLLRKEEVIHEGAISTLRRHKDDAAEVAEGFECGINITGYNAIEIGDIIEAFEIKEVARKL